MNARTDHARILNAELRSALHLGRAALHTATGREPRPGQSTKHALSHLRSIRGLSDVTVDVNPATATVAVHVTVNTSHTIADPAALLRFLAGTAWSVQGFRPDTLTVFVDSDPAVDLLAAAGAWSQAFGDETIVMIPTAELGGWPGPVQYLDDDVLSPV